ncbi:MAG: aminopeptidase P family protein [Cytophaga sp.]|uniref:aminopeptidase P family protein n=1 Tax=Cytophaga sp. TaxID=29535 RepID=UPI003F800033
MKYTPINKSFFIQNRRKLAEMLDASSIAVFHSNDVYPTNADGTMPFRQNNDLFYFSGIDQEDTILVLFPDSTEPKYKEVLFIIETNEHIAIWEGNKLTKDKARELSGIETVFWFHEFDTVFKQLAYDAANIYCDQNEHARAEKLIDTRNDRFIQSCKTNYPLHALKRLAPISNALRSVKDPAEIDTIRKACDITKAAFERILKTIKPGMREYQIEADIIYEFVRQGSRGHAYQPIIASGANACVLHYIQNDQVCNDGDLILMDFGAEYGNYASDLTRVVPVNGKFNSRQKEVYTAVLNVFKEIKKIIRPGITLQELNIQTGKLMTRELIQLNVLKQEDIEKPNGEQAYKRYFMHGIGHHLGLDVHDVHVKNAPLKEGMVITLEPGIYIREESIGIRLENDILVVSNGNIDLMEHIPIEIDEIESIMHS